MNDATVEYKSGPMRNGRVSVDVVDLPGIYSFTPGSLEERITCSVILGKMSRVAKPEVAVVIADATNVERSLFLISQLIEHDIRPLVAMNMVDAAAKHGITVDTQKLAEEIGCPVVPTVARIGEGTSRLITEIEHALTNVETPGSGPVPFNFGCTSCGTCPFQARYTWSEQVASRCVRAPPTGAPFCVDATALVAVVATAAAVGGLAH